MYNTKQFVTATVAIALTATVAQSQTRLGSPQDAGINVVVPNTVVFDKGEDNQSNWEGYASKLGDGTLLLGVNTIGDNGGEVMGVVAVSPDGTVSEYAAYYTDAGEPYTNNMDEIRQNGNPPSISGDRTPGSTRYIVGNESTPYLYSEFDTDDRWQNDYVDHIWACQVMELTADGPVKVSNVFDPVYGGMTGVSVGKIRKGGVAALSNGNFIAVGEDRTGDNTARGSIVSEDGTVINGPINWDNDGYSHDYWENLTAYDGGFAIRLSPPKGVDGGLTTIQFYDNDGNFKGMWEQISTIDPDDPVLDVNDNPFGDTTSINSNSRGDSIRIRSSWDGSKIYYVGTGLDFFATNGWVYLTVIDGNTYETIANIRVNEQPEDENGYDNFAKGERVSMDIDSQGNVIVAWSDSANSDTLQIQARIFDADLNPVTETFLAFQDADLGYGTEDGEIVGVETKHCDVAMSDTQILISARSEGGIIDPNGDGSAFTKVNQNIITVLENPFAGTHVENWSLF